MDVNTLIQDAIIKPAPGALVIFAIVKGIGALWGNLTKSKELGFSKEKLLNDGILSLVNATQAQVQRIEEECKELRSLLEASQAQTAIAQSRATHETELREAAEVLVESHFAASKIAESALASLNVQYQEALIKIDDLQSQLMKKTGEYDEQSKLLVGLYDQVRDFKVRIRKLEVYIKNHKLPVPGE